VVEQLPDAPAAGATNAAGPGVDATGAGGFSQDASAPSPFVTSCCGKRVNQLDAILGLVLESLPQFVSRFQNTNLFTAGLRMLSTMPAQLGDVQGAIREFKRATDKQGAQAALAQLVSAASSLRQSTQAAFQKEPTP
jgi:hypothetical protein